MLRNDNHVLIMRAEKINHIRSMPEVNVCKIEQGQARVQMNRNHAKTDVERLLSESFMPYTFDEE